MNFKSFFSRIAALAATALIVSSTAQVSSMPTVDLTLGPVAVNAQAVNIALALSVEFPTLGAAYRTAAYTHATKYLGYWDNTACYSYFDETDTSTTVAGQYFVRTGSTDAAGYCNTAGAGTGYAGNLLNFAATSSIDLLRYALTGGNRVLDTADKTVLARAFLASDFRSIHQGTGGYWPEKTVASSLVGKVTPVFTNPTGGGNYTGTVYFNSCDDFILVGNTNTGGDCNNPGNSNVFGPNVPNLNGSFTTAGFVVTPADTASTTYVATGAAYWGRSNPNVTTTVMPSGTDPVAGTLVPEAVTPTPRNFSVVTGTQTTAQYSGDAVAGTSYAPTAGTSTTAPVTAAESPAVIRGYYWTGATTTTTPITAAESTAVVRGYYWTGNTTTVVPLAAAEATPAVRGYIWTDSGQFAFNYQGNGAPNTTLTATRNTWVCYDSASPNIIRRGPDTNSAACPAGQTRFQYTSSSASSRIYYNYYTQGAAYYREYAPFYRAYAPFYRVYTATPYYNIYQLTPAWYQASVYQVFEVYSNVSQYKMKAYVQVCQGAEATARTDLCLRYPNGNYKPAGQIQQYATGARVAAFGYALENGTARYGGVLRAPMRFTGPSYTDENGQIQTNAKPEWDVNSGVYTTDPLGASPTYTYSGVINYLNRFGTTGTPGTYKSNDPVGELYYEALRYFQGLGPTAAATSGLAAGAYDGYPIYSTVVSSTSTTPGWTDPVQNACQRRNFILAVGDVNTHADKQLPGHRSSSTASVNESTIDPSRALEPLLGSSTLNFDAPYWTSLLAGFETGASVNYTDALGRAQTTAGNPNTVSNNSGLNSKATGATSSAFYWAGAAYWANTQPIRMDSKGGQSMSSVRVKTFTIDVDEGGNGLIDGNTRGIKPRESSFYLAGKYGWYNDANLDGNPFKTSGGITNNAEWEDATTPNTPDGYVIASQAQKMIDGIKKFFSSATSAKGAVSVSSLSSQRFTTQSPNGDLFAPRFNTTDWSGTVQRSSLRLNTTTGSIDTVAGTIWDAGVILTSASVSGSSTLSDPYVRPSSRNIITFARDGSSTRGVAFTVAGKGDLDAAVVAALNTNPASGSTDSLSDQRINYLRGDRSNEVTGTGGTLRRRNSVMGDIINSGPVYKKGADPTVTGPGYGDFANGRNGREAMIYVGANDGMLHGLRASDGKEMFAYIPRAIATSLNRLTNPAYTHQPFVDGVPIVGEAQIGSNWKTVLVSGMGGGAQGVFALDVTDPGNFGTSNAMFEFTDQDDSDMGNVMTQPKIVKMRLAGSGTPTYKWYVAVSSGYNNYKTDSYTSSTGRQALFLLSLDKSPTDPWTLNGNYYKIVLADPANTTTPNGLANPGYATGSVGEAVLMYAGDLQGNVWRFDFSSGLSTSNVAAAVKTSSSVPIPMFISKDSAGTRQPITTSPLVSPGRFGGFMVVVGTGKFVEPGDTSTAGTQSIYGIYDPISNTVTDYQIGRSKLYQRTVVESTVTTISGSDTFALGTGTGTYRGWFFDLSQTRERVAVEGAQGTGFVAMNTTIPDGQCSGDGTGRSFCLNPTYGNSACTISLTSAGLLSRPNVVNISTDTESMTTRSSTGKRTARLTQGLVTTGTKITDAGNVASSTSRVAGVPDSPAGRVSWREIRSFRDN